MPLAFCYPLNRSYLFSYNDSIADVKEIVAKDLKCDAKNIYFRSKKGYIVTRPEDQMIVQIFVETCEKHSQK